jgi:hypothetical protein
MFYLSYNLLNGLLESFFKNQLIEVCILKDEFLYTNLYNSVSL